MADVELFSRFGAALAIGVLIGLQREYAHGGPEEELFAGVRTFALISLLGAAGALAADELGSPWGFAGLVLPMGALLVMAYFISAWHHEATGLTTEVATLLAVTAGALCYWGYLALGAAVGVSTTVLLSLKPEMHAFARRITREDIYATLKFAVITVIVLPVLPNQEFGPPPLDVLNPHEIWLMVVLISGISFLGYVLIKLVGARHGISLSGLLGGLVSSTAVTLNFARRSQEEELERSFAVAIIVAWTMSFIRILIEVATVNRPLLAVVWPPLAAASAVGLLYGAYLYVLGRSEEREEIDFSNPFELGTALKFGLLFAVVLVVSKAASLYAGSVGVYLSSFFSAIPGVDAMTLSIARLSGGMGGLALTTGARAIVVGAMSNTLAKGGFVMATGSMGLRRAVLPGLLLVLATGVASCLVL
ncbi:MAG: MgtC/SapB family protein [Anaerolineae bacterium]